MRFSAVKLNDVNEEPSNSTMNPMENDVRTKKEIDKFPNITSSSSSRSEWSSSSFKNPRIVRVSRNFSGKDRHSKVCTVRGLRDRRIRLSVPTAIQLYDLQDRLGLGQPSKVVDWLIDVVRNDIDKLPPLPMIPGLTTHDQSHHQPTLISTSHESHQEGFVAQNFFPLSNDQFSVPNLLPYNSYFNNWDPPNLSLSQFGGGFSFATQTDEEKLSHTNISSSSQMYLCPSGNTLPSIFPPFSSYNHTSSSMENDYLRQINFFQN